MKKLGCILLCIALLIGAVALCCPTFVDGNFAYAATNEYRYEFTSNGRTIPLVTIVNPQGNPVGVRFSGYYFGASSITVMADVYSQSDFVIDFPINSAMLTAEQLAVRARLETLFSEVSDYIDYIDLLANTTYNGQGNLPTSDVYRYNEAKQGDVLTISAETYEMLTLAREMYNATNGAFNPAVYRLVDLWGFSSRIFSNGQFGLPYDRQVMTEPYWSYPLPDEKYISVFSNASFTDFSQQAVTLEARSDGTYTVTKNVAPVNVEGVDFQQWIDLGGIAKGYVVDVIKQKLSELGFTRYNVDAGSSSMAFGLAYDGGQSVIGMSDAFDPASAIFPTSLLSVQVANASISTSGQNVRKYTVDGVEYAHIINGVTGAPAQTGVRSVMVVVPDSAGDFWATKGDCLTTALTVMGRDGIVGLINGYLNELGIKVVVQYQTLDGRKQLLSNYDLSEIVDKSQSFGEFGWALETDKQGNYVYNANVKFDRPVNGFAVALIVGGCVLGVAIVALVVYHFVRGKRRLVSNLQNARKDKPFKIGDVMVYLGVAIVILVLFYVFFFNADSTQVQIVNVVDDEAGETLFTYNVTRGEYLINTDNVNGWQIEVVEKSFGVEVTFTRDFGDETRFNTVRITRGQEPSVKMIDSQCGFHQDCVRNFDEVTRSGGAIVCSPNRLKIVTE